MSTPLSRSRRGFTLIELLIVVAIIAILAAIAIPNFLEAQVRSKVSRTKSDLRTVATAVEAYRVDYNQYPPDRQNGPIPDRDLFSYLPRFVVLTTPVGYITAVPEDVFAASALGVDPSFAEPYRIPFATGNYARPYAFDYACRVLPDGSDEEAFTPGLWTDRIAGGKGGVMWAMRSVGPDNIATQLGSEDSRNTRYDPTNGTTSAGDVFYLGPGVGLDGGPVR